ncbi:MAG: TonB-dependent receptor [Bacteroidales bacterium]|nr:TonB-dependent receptor [Bacteroidales bacterium]
MRKINVSLILLSFSLLAFNQNLNQTIRGKIIDKQSQIPLIGVTVIVLNSNPLIGTISDVNGNFRLEKIPVGRINLKFSYIGYKEQLINNVIITSGKELILEIGLEEEINRLEEVVVKASNRKEALNQMATVSARSFTVEQTQRYAGSLMDPARMATNYAGVIAANDERNDIIIRGNSPMGLLWKLEGISIPNPNHFAENGTTGGAVSILNNNNLSNSDFFTGAFPAEYGNAISGVFDLKLRNGNDQNYEYTLQAGFMGLECGAEGPFGNKTGNSFIANYRYSTISLLDKLGVTGSEIPSIPKYQDITFKLNFKGNEKFGKFTIFGIGGLSKMDYKFIQQDDDDFDTHDQNENINSYMNSNMGVLCVSNLKIINSKSYLKTVVSSAISTNGNTTDTILSNSTTKTIQNRTSETVNSVLSSYYNYKQNTKNNYKIGINVELKSFNYEDSIYINNHFQKILFVNDNCALAQIYTQWQHKFSDKLILNEGINYQYFNYTNSNSIEPRIGIKYIINNYQSVNFGMGIHSQIQPLVIYMYETQINNNQYIKTNKDLDFTKSFHMVFGYDIYPNNNLKIKIEPYYQYLYNIPVEQKESNVSVLNIGSDFELPVIDSLVNNGTGKNYGIDLTLERFFSNNYYFLVTGSLYESKYKGSDNIERNTVFNGNYALNALGGFEINLSKKLAFSSDAKISFLGNRRYIPIDLTQSKLLGYAVLNYNNAYKNRYKNYFRADLKISLRKNKINTTQYFILDIMNLFNTQNIYQQVFNPKTNTISSIYQYGIMPNFIYKIEF